jgi:hypothetical protein
MPKKTVPIDKVFAESTVKRVSSQLSRAAGRDAGNTDAALSNQLNGAPLSSMNRDIAESLERSTIQSLKCSATQSHSVHIAPNGTSRFAT